MSNNDISIQSNYEIASQYDVQSLIEYKMHKFCMNYDWPGNNNKLLKQSLVKVSGSTSCLILISGLKDGQILFLDL